MPHRDPGTITPPNDPHFAGDFEAEVWDWDEHGWDDEDDDDFLENDRPRER